MPKKGKSEIVLGSSSPPTVMDMPDFSNIIQADVPISWKRAFILEQLGEKKTKKKYATKVERQEAAKARAKERREARKALLAPYGLEPKKKVSTLTQEQRKARSRAKRRERSLKKKEFLHDMIKSNPELAKKYGIDTGRFKL